MELLDWVVLRHLLQLSGEIPSRTIGMVVLLFSRSTPGMQLVNAIVNTMFGVIFLLFLHFISLSAHVQSTFSPG